MFGCACVCLSAIAASASDAPDRLLTRQGVDIVLDEDVFALFAALNAAGYSEETERKGPPLVAPVFHPVRVDARHALREAAESASLRSVRAVFEAHPVPIEVYLEAVLAGDTAAPPRAGRLRTALMPVLARFRREATLEALFDRLVDRQRAHALALHAHLESDFDRAGALLGVKTLRAPNDAVVVPNLLDAHGQIRAIRQARARFLVVGPSLTLARAAVVNDAVAAALEPAAQRAFAQAPSYQKSWESLKASRRIRTRYQNGARYLAESVARAVAHRVIHPDANRDADEDFIDDQAKRGMRWARAGLKIVDAGSRGHLAATLPARARKTSP